MVFSGDMHYVVLWGLKCSPKGFPIHAGYYGSAQIGDSPCWLSPLCISSCHLHHLHHCVQNKCINPHQLFDVLLGDMEVSSEKLNEAF